METKRVFAEVMIWMVYAALRTQAGGEYLALVSGNDIFVCLPMRSRNSLRYSGLPGVFNEVHRLQSLSFIFVVSLLAALMRECEIRFSSAEICAMSL